MRVSRNLIGIASTLVLLGLTPVGFTASDRMKAGEPLLVMDD